MNEEGFSVTECLGGSMELGEEELGLRYQVRISGWFCVEADLELIGTRCAELL